jgi:hypothetical protein
MPQPPPVSNSPPTIETEAEAENGDAGDVAVTWDGEKAE